MCGIQGYIDVHKTLTGSEKAELAKAGITVGEMRGTDNTGIFFNTSNNDAIIEKVSQKGSMWAKSNAFKTSVLDKLEESSYCVAHNRSGSIGGWGVESAHPFKTDNFIGVHNGTLHRSYESIIPLATTFNTDSEALYNYIDLVGFEKAIGEVPGAMALVWLDTTSNTINFFRNSERPLTLAKTRTGKGAEEAILFASEPRLLAFAATSAEIKYEEPISLPENTLVSYSLDNGIMSVSEEVAIASRPPSRQYTYPNVNYNNNIVPFNKGKTSNSNHISYTNNILSSVVKTVKRVGDAILFYPSSITEKSAGSTTVTLKGTHTWEHDAAIAATDTYFDVVMYDVDRQVAEVILNSGMSLSAEITSTSRINQVVHVQVNKSNLKLHDIFASGRLKSAIADLMQLPNTWRHIATEVVPETTKGTPKTIPCGYCGGGLTDTDSSYLMHRTMNEWIHEDCESMYHPLAGTTNVDFTRVIIGEGDDNIPY